MEFGTKKNHLAKDEKRERERERERERAGSKVRRHVGTGSGVHMADPNSPAKDS